MTVVSLEKITTAPTHAKRKMVDSLSYQSSSLERHAYGENENLTLLIFSEHKWQSPMPTDVSNQTSIAIATSNIKLKTQEVKSQHHNTAGHHVFSGSIYTTKAKTTTKQYAITQTEKVRDYLKDKCAK